MEFEWDEAKNLKNIANHRLPFSIATAVFDDPKRMERYDIEHSADEDRWQTIGLAGKVLFVVYTEKRDKIRIISARVAESEERSIYYGNSDVYPEGWYCVDP
ncbi:MAG: BrnT family toxin [Spirochaetaceae bacterium]|jgi:uncharacterized DUF497 family protein|nr:BrnT family toxin [Spirochaetaceae bacterium]